MSAQDSRDARDAISCRVTVDAPPSSVWRLATSPEGLCRWFAFDGAEVEAVPGGAAAFTWKEHGTYRGVVEQADPGRVFAFRWSLDPGADPLPGRSTRVELRLRPEEGGGTRVELRETGFGDLPLPEGRRRDHAEENARAWQVGLALLKEAAEADRHT
ncbi:SRPBCC domain-containing protein [Nocardiopsis halophila]|uniref:SRPBCC domain-containing protein n=1 Tax=Nocardiopsis halophila TaxID=141692 RepID=UPI000349EDC5|nr:SRPBCC domain-containing protein [Nocardiopsis halophila]